MHNETGRPLGTSAQEWLFVSGDIHFKPEGDCDPSHCIHRSLFAFPRSALNSWLCQIRVRLHSSVHCTSQCSSQSYEGRVCAILLIERKGRTSRKRERESERERAAERLPASRDSRRSRSMISSKPLALIQKLFLHIPENERIITRREKCDIEKISFKSGYISMQPRMIC